MESSKLITFLVPAYNSEVYLHICLDSLLKCDTSKIEILVVDDGSKDKTGEIADKYHAEHPDVIRVIHKENGGHGDAINDGVREAKGKYFKIVDSDDWVDESALNKTIKVLEENKSEPDLYIMNYRYFVGYDNPDKIIAYRTVFNELVLHTLNDAKFIDLQKNLTLHSCMFKLDVIKKSNAPLPRKVSYEDNYFVYAGLCNINTFVYIDCNFYCYLIGRDGQSVSRDVCIRKYKDHLLISKLMNDYFDLMSIKKTDKRRFGVLYHHIRLVFMIAVIYSRLNKTKEAHEDYKNFVKDLKTKHIKLYRKLRYRSVAGLLMFPGAFGRFVVKFGIALARLFVPFYK